MNLFHRLFGLDRIVEQKLKKFERDRAEDNQLFTALYSHMSNLVPVTYSKEDFIRNGYEQNSTLYAITTWIAKNAARIPLVFKSGGEIVENAELQDILDCPNPDEGYEEFMTKYILFKLLTGNSYIYAPIMDNGKFTEMWVMPADMTEIVFGNVMEPVQGYKVTDWWTSGVIDAEKVIHSKFANLTFGSGAELYGFSPVQAALDTLRKSNSNFEALYRAYENGGAAGLLKDLTAIRNSPAGAGSRVNTADLKNAQDQFDAKLAGADKAGKKIYTSLDIDWVPFGMSPVDLALHADQEATLREFCRVYGVASELFGDKAASTYNNMREAVRWSLTQGVVPHVESFVDEFNRQWISRFDPNLRLDIDTSSIPELQPDKNAEVERKSKSYWITPNELREADGLEPKEGGDEPLVPAGSIPLSMAGTTTFEAPKSYPLEARLTALKALDYELTPTFKYTAEAIANGQDLPESKLSRIKTYLNNQTQGENFEAYGGEAMKEFLNSGS